MANRKQCFPPVVSPEVRLLILGSLPGEASLAASQYYAHPRNQFWRLLGEVLDEPLGEMPYADRLGCLLEHRVGLWDVVAQARRQGSLDAALNDIEHNDLLALTRSLPRLEAIGFNGGTAFKAAKSLAGSPLALLALPSSSPAYTRPYEEKLAIWLQLRRYM
ncbi:DNA-deoxyinosine glycosylase [Pseudogulbenkiania subflava]|uniref:G/U mismatch-specific uracil-DNA glycosylase n=1 Tax=Pseudogulbenkiania subflava DSM 22618 TaxID=1123014 RepID=A0A1Y6C5N6_9NEIS|nr:DNA-deoxyinosine glycosylase [Pseudogulbenkiania subflava]SMF44381.1 G/U mismatch-specific uracil-DNA glycosylase [Pseudogulbenkiania subflava DSM 22618]